MIGMDQYEMIRTAHRQYGKGIRALAKEFGHHRRTIRKILAGWEPRYRRNQPLQYPVMGQVSEVVKRWLTEDLSRPEKQRHTAFRIYTRLMEEHDFKGAYSTVRHWVSRCRADMGCGMAKAVLPLCPEVAREAEVDWGTVLLIMNGKTMEAQLFEMRSRYSGKIFTMAYPCARQEMFFDGHQMAFEFFGGVFPIMIYDNLSSAVKRVLRGKRREEQERFVSFRSYYTFEARFCNPGKGNEKGGVEGGIGYARRNFFVPLPDVDSYQALNRYLWTKCREHDLHVLGGREDRRPIAERHQEERGRLLPLPAQPMETAKLVPVKICSYQTAQIDRNRYSVPTAYVGRKLRAQIGCWKVEIFDGSKRVAEHDRVFGNSQWQINPLHYLELLKQRIGAFDSARAICQWEPMWPACYRDMLKWLVQKLGNNQGKRDFVRILQLHQGHPAEQVAAAVSEALRCCAISYDAVKHLLLLKEKKVVEVFPLLSDRLPGITDLPVAATDLNDYGALLVPEVVR